MNKVIKQSLIALSIASVSAMAQAKTTLTLWNGFTGPDRPYVVSMIDEYNKTHPDVEIKMEIMPWDSLHQKLTMALPSGQAPDLVSFDSIFVSTYAQGGYLAPLDDMYKSGRIDPKNMPEALHKSVLYNNMEYAVPFNFATIALYYNKTLFKDAGLDPNSPPKTWDELTANALKLSSKIKGRQQYGLALASKETIQTWPIFLWNGGGTIIQDGKAVLNSSENKGTFKKWTTLVTENKISSAVITGSQADKLFETGRAAMMMNGPWAAPGFKKAGLDFGVAQIPAGPAGNYTLGTSVTTVITSSSKHIAQAKDFLEWWNSAETQVKFASMSGFPPIRLDLQDNSELKKNLYLSAFLEAAPNSRFYLQGQHDIPAIEGNILVPMYESILLKLKTSDQALDEANAKLQKMLDKNSKS